MKTMTVEEIYQEHIEPLPTEERLRLLSMMAEGLADEAHDTAGCRKRSVMEFHGVGANDPIGMDAQEYVNQLREGRDPGP